MNFIPLLTSLFPLKFDPKISLIPKLGDILNRGTLENFDKFTVVCVGLDVCIFGSKAITFDIGIVYIQAKSVCDLCLRHLRKQIMTGSGRKIRKYRRHLWKISYEKISSLRGQRNIAVKGQSSHKYTAQILCFIFDS